MFSRLVIGFLSLIVQATQSTGNGDLFQAYLNKGATSFQEGDYSKAEDCFLAALGLAGSFEPANGRRVVVLNDLGKVYETTQQYEMAERMFKESAEIIPKTDPDGYLSAVMNNLGQLYMYQGKFKEAERTLNSALSVSRRSAPYAETVIADIQSNLGIVQARKKKFLDAEASIESALRIRTAAAGSHSVKAAESLDDLGAIYILERRYVKAAETLEEALTIAESLLDPEHPDLAVILENLGIAENKQQHYAAAEEFFERSALIRSRARQIISPEVLVSHADTLRNLNRNEEAAVMTAKMKRVLAQQRFTRRVGP